MDIVCQTGFFCALTSPPRISTLFDTGNPHHVNFLSSTLFFLPYFSPPQSFGEVLEFAGLTLYSFLFLLSSTFNIYFYLLLPPTLLEVTQVCLSVLCLVFISRDFFLSIVVIKEGRYLLACIFSFAKLIGELTRVIIGIKNGRFVFFGVLVG